MDRVIQQAIVQILTPIYEEQFSIPMDLDQIVHVKWQL